MCNLANLSRVTFWRTFSNSTRQKPKTTQFFLYPHFAHYLQVHMFVCMCLCVQTLFHLLFDFNFLVLIVLFVLFLFLILIISDWRTGSMQLVWISYGNIASSIFFTDATWLYRFMDAIAMMMVMVWRAECIIDCHFIFACSSSRCSLPSQWTCNNKFQLNAIIATPNNRAKKRRSEAQIKCVKQCM